MKIDLTLNKIKAEVKVLAINKLLPLIDSTTNYWKHLSEREQWIIKIGGGIITITLIFLIISSAIDFKNNLANTVTTNNAMLANTKTLANQLKDLRENSPNNFTTVAADKIKDDVKQIFAIKNPNIAFADKILTIQIPEVKFELVMLFLDQLRKSYGIYPTQLKITRSSQSGFVNFSATFDVEE